MDLLACFNAIGFTEYEAKVYLALLEHNPSTGYQISKRAGIQRSMVYESLGHLHARGAVMRNDETRATIYRPVPPDVLINRYQQEQDQLIRDLRQGLKALYRPDQDELHWSLRHSGSVISYAAKLIEDAHSKVSVLVADRELLVLRGAIQIACERGLQVRLISSGEGKLPCGQTARFSIKNSEFEALPNLLVVVKDQDACLQGSTELPQQEMIASLTNDRRVIAITRRWIDTELHLWQLHNEHSLQPPAKSRPAEVQDSVLVEPLQTS